MAARGPAHHEALDCSWDEARGRAAGSVRPIAAHRVPLIEACGGVVAADVHALSDLPETDVSAMDASVIVARAGRTRLRRTLTRTIVIGLFAMTVTTVGGVIFATAIDAWIPGRGP